MLKDKKPLIVSAVSLMLCSCSLMPDWLGNSDKVKDTSGPRVSVLSLGTTISVDPDLSSLQVPIPTAQDNAQWAKSSSDHVGVPQNIAAPKTFKHGDSVSIGKGANKDQHMTATPIVANDKIYTVDSYGVVTAFDTERVKKIWKYELDVKEDKGSLSNAGILFHQGKIYLATGSNKVIALDAETGSVVWKRNINSIARSAPAAEGKVVVVNTADNKLYALDANDGGIMWMHSGAEGEMSIFGSAAPVVSNHFAFAPYSSGELYALKLDDGSEVWSDSMTSSRGNNNRFLFGNIDSSPVIVGDNIYVVGDDGALVASDMATGHRLWEKSLSATKSPWFAAGFIYVVNSKSEVICVSAKNGGVKWVSKLPSEKKNQTIWSGPVMAGDSLLVVGSNGKLLSISPRTGEIENTTKVSKGIYLNPVVANGSVYLLTDKAELIVLR
ncbi:MAG: pyrrolo-quinoline quinone [Rickettsiaceae bacterium]|jgi:outer membrane protein assembly factor BamB|nr:pyrrolo-quinoline quinone [Rickettsiaceae bacterium]